MASRSEEVLLIVNHVRNKKTDGTLYLMGERLGWMQGSKSTFSISYLYADIKAQKISPDFKEKVQLQLVLHDGSANTLHFNNPHGRDDALKDRESIKELLQQLLPKFRRKLNSELEEKNKMLQENPELFQLYKDLVVSGVITAEEFWASRKATNTTKPETKQQPVGVSAAFLADIKPQTDGCNGLKYNLTADVIESIFRTYPMVKMKHAEFVPHQMTENEFWTRFFQSHYFHRDRTNISNKDVFSECAKNDEKEMSNEVSTKVTDPLLDLTKITDSTLDDGYGLNSGDRKASNNQTNLTMIRRFNHHSTMVLKACKKDDGSQSADNDGSETHNGQTLVNGTVEIQSKHNSKSETKVSKTNGHTNHKINHDEPRPSTSSGHSDQHHHKRKKIIEKIQYDDLVNQEDRGKVNLTLHKMEGYLHGPTPVKVMRYTSSEDVIKATQKITEEMQSWTPDLSMVLNGTNAIQTLGELSPGGALMKGTSNQQLNQMIPLEVQDAVKSQYNALLELLRHFWSCFPVSSKLLEEKVVKMKSTLEKFQMAKLNPLRDKLEYEHYSMNLTDHMEELLSAAYRKFDTWQSRKSSSKR